ncbi:cytochrome P450 [Cryptosporangium sp. NPDC048952]|uniref:cytochrome P450 n=1 Tax=Cryptosporangium sp. NPDC048952 TaxID=3363961 RepID=UPI003721C787
MAETAELPEFPMPRSGRCPFAPPPELLKLHDSEKPLRRVRIWDGTTPWLVTGHAAERELLADSRVSANLALDGYPHSTQATKAHAGTRTSSINSADGAEHLRWRRMLTNSFTRSRMVKLRPEIQQITDDLIDRMLAGPNPTELNEAFSLPLPSLMICALLGVPYEDHAFFQEHAGVINGLYRTPEQNAESGAILRRYIGELVQKKIDAPSEDVLSDLGQRITAGEMTLDEATSLGHILLVAGHDTSANMITLSTALLLQEPEQLTALRERSGDEKFVANAVEELLRYLTIPHMHARRAILDDIDFHGETIRAGEGVITSLPAANWDPVAFPEPERLLLDRRASHHITFGWGPHQCVGQQLARVELQVVFSTLFRRIPTLRLAAPLEELKFKADSQAFGIYELPVAW